MTSKIGVSWTQSLAFLFLRIFNSFEMAVLQKGCKPYNFEPYNSLKHSFKNIRSLRSKFVVYESFPASNSPEILALCETKLDDSIYFCNFSLSVYVCVCVCVCVFVWHLSFFRRILLLLCIVFQFIWGKGFLLHGTYLYENLRILTYVFDWLYFIQCLTSFSSIDHLLRLYARFLTLFHLT